MPQISPTKEYFIERRITLYSLDLCEKGDELQSNGHDELINIHNHFITQLKGSFGKEILLWRFGSDKLLKDILLAYEDSSIAICYYYY